eukprot:536088_1
MAMKDANIYCPPDYLSGTKYTNNAICDISVNGSYSLMGTKIYANEGFNNVRIKCEYSICFTGGKDVPVLWCGESLDKGCILQLTNKSDQLICDTDICNKILPTFSPSSSPTLQPTTSNPTFSPTKYDPNQESIHKLYLSNKGCDYGLCNSKNFYINNYVCNLNGIASLSQYNKCCNNNNSVSPSTTFVSSMDCDKNNTLTINNPG